MENVITRESETFVEMVSKIKAMENEVEIMKENKLSCGNQWLSGDEIVQKLGISKRTLQNYRDNKILPYSAVGGKFYYNIRDIEALMIKNYMSMVNN